jgi:hypothetical protein
MAGLHDGTDAGGRAMQEQLPRQQGRIELAVPGLGSHTHQVKPFGTIQNAANEFQGSTGGR